MTKESSRAQSENAWNSWPRAGTRRYANRVPRGAPRDATGATMSRRTQSALKTRTRPVARCVRDDAVLPKKSVRSRT